MQSLTHLIWARAWLLLIFTTILWGGNGVASRLAVGRISPMSLVCLRWLLVSTVLAVMLRGELQRERGTLHAHRWRILLMAGFGFTGFNTLFYAAGYWTTALNIVLLQAAIPPLVLAGAALSRSVRVTGLQLAGVAVSLFGVALIATHGAPQRIAEIEFNTGDVLILIACVFYAGYTLALRKRPALQPLVFFTALSLAAFATSIPAMIAEIALGKFAAPTAGGIAILAYVAIGPSLIAQLCYMRGIELIGPARAGLFNNLTPIFGALFAVMLLGEEFHLYHAIALALALGGIWLAERKRG